MLGISRATFYRVLRRGDFPVVLIGRSPRIPVSALRLWIDSQLCDFPATEKAKVG